jgi:hypothetical protein
MFQKTSVLGVTRVILNGVARFAVCLNMRCAVPMPPYDPPRMTMCFIGRAMSFELNGVSWKQNAVQKWKIFITSAERLNIAKLRERRLIDLTENGETTSPG